MAYAVAPQPFLSCITKITTHPFGQCSLPVACLYSSLCSSVSDGWAYALRGELRFSSCCLWISTHSSPTRPPLQRVQASSSSSTTLSTALPLLSLSSMTRAHTSAMHTLPTVNSILSSLTCPVLCSTKQFLTYMPCSIRSGAIYTLSFRFFRRCLPRELLSQTTFHDYQYFSRHPC